MNEEERKLMMTMAKTIDDVDKRLKVIENDIVAAEAEADGKYSRTHGTSKIDIIFKDSSTDEKDRHVLVESIYTTLKKLCETHGVFNLKINIDN